MQIAFIINDRYCPPGILTDVVSGAGHDIVEFYPHEGDELPTEVPGEWNGLVSFGGRMGAYDDDEYPTLKTIADLIAKVHAQQLPYLGVCLGAQQLARALGEPKVSMNTAELGFAPMSLTKEGQTDSLLAGLTAPAVMQVHQDSFSVPGGGTLLLSGDHVEAQGFRVGPYSYGFQCHFEVTEDYLIKWVDMIEGEYGEYLDETQTRMVRTARTDRDTLLPAAQEFGTQLTLRWLDIAKNQKQAA